MTLTQLKYIIAVDTHRHFATAADHCYVTQPTLSMQIHKLEDELGIQIFDRSKQPVVPTPQGFKIVEQARVILKHVQQLEDLATQHEGELRGTFKVGIIPTVAPYLIPLFLQKFSAAYPKIELIFEETKTQQLLTRLQQDQLDIGIIATPAQQANMHEEDLYYEPFIGYLSEDHSLSQKTELSVKDLEIDNLWLLEDGHCFRDQAVKLCKKSRNDSPKTPIQFQSGNLETLKKLVEQNFGMTLLPYLAIDQLNGNHSNARIKNFEHPIPRRKVRLVYGRLHLKDNIVNAFKEVIQDCIPRELLDKEESLIVE